MIGLAPAALLCAHTLFASLAQPSDSNPLIVVAGVVGVEPQSQCLALRLTKNGDWCVLDDFGTFGVGDTVVAVSSMVVDSTCGGHDIAYMPANTVGAWRSFDFGCGTMMVGDGGWCEIMYSAVYGRLRIAGNTGFHSGDTIRLRANLYLQSCYTIPECSGNLCVDHPMAEACPLPAVDITWGRLTSLYLADQRRKALTRP